MDVRFVSYSELKTYFEKERLEKDLEEKSKMGICSAADLLFITEDYKKGTLTPHDNMENTFEKFQEGPENSGQIFVANLDSVRLSEAMFEKLIEGVELWETAASRKLSPRDSITYLALRVTPDTWLPEEVFDEMYSEYELDKE
jgi:hypothetical protein